MHRVVHLVDDIESSAVTAATSGNDPRFVCDEMLGRLARYLRAAGYDTALASGGAPDRRWIDVARREARTLLTCDRQLLHHKAAQGYVLWLRQGRLDHQASVLRDQLGVDWLWRPFTRCLVDNARLQHAGELALGRLPPDLRSRAVRECPACGRIYWAGSHHRRMRARLADWAGGTAGRGGAKLPLWHDEGSADG